jgi:hypothetical protein
VLDVPPVVAEDVEVALVDVVLVLAAARGSFDSTCTALTIVKATLALLRIILRIPIQVIIIIAILAVLSWLFGFGLFAVFLWAIVFVYGIAWFLSMVFGVVAVRLGQALAAELTAIEDAIMKAQQACPGCPIDTSLPTCKAAAGP